MAGFCCREKMGHDGDSEDEVGMRAGWVEGERAGCGAGIKTPDKFSKRAGSLAGSQQGVALCRRCKSWGRAEGRDSAGKLTGIIPPDNQTGG